jgi:alkylresorcinol/alkylpyrone synthase
VFDADPDDVSQDLELYTAAARARRTAKKLVRIGPAGASASDVDGLHRYGHEPVNVADAQSSQLDSPSLTVGGATALADPVPLSHPRISRLEIADAETSFSQDEVLALLGMRGDEFAERIFGRCGVHRRRLNLSGDVLATTLQGRTTQIEDELFGFAVAAVERLEVDPLQVGTVVTATLYSLGGPTLAHRLVDHFRMEPDTDKYHVVGVGCASAVPLMRLAGQSLHHHPGKLGLVVAAESMTGILMGACADDAKAKVIGSAIFGDGCAAALVSDDFGADGPAIVSAKVHQIAGTLDAVSLELAAQDSYLHLNRDLPDVAAAGLGELAESFLDSAGIDRAAIDHWIVHPGGRRIIDCVQTALSLSDEDVAVSRDVLANHGNIGTPSIFYVLHQTIEQREPRPGDRGLVVTIGPGITVGLMLLQW